PPPEPTRPRPGPCPAGLRANPRPRRRADPDCRDRPGTGISPRHLQSGFRRYLGMTPHQFLRDCRLDEAHRMLSTAGLGQTATTIAYDCGFGHLGDFAHDYRIRFGEPPSETLRRSRVIS